MAAGTAAGLVPIRSITRSIPSSNPRSLAATLKQHDRLSVADGSETVAYIPDGQEQPGSICLKLLGQLKGIQVGKVEDTFNWCYKVREEDGNVEKN